MAEKEEFERAVDVVTEQEQEYAQKALNEFKKNNYAGALQFINKLDNRTNDFKVAHNKALVEYCKSDFRKNETFQKNLTSICNQFKIRLDKLDDVDQCIVHYNQAILLYHQQQYTNAIYIMDRVYKFIEPMDDALAKQVSLFAIELQLCVRQSDKALSLINYLENQLINGTPNIKLLDKTVKEKDKKAPQPLDPAMEEFKKKLIKYKIRCYLMNHNLEIANKEISNLLKDKQNFQALFLAANLEYLKGNLIESQKLLAAVPPDYLVYNDSGESSTLMFYNNMGVIHHAMGKPNLACHYFQLALKEDIALTNNAKKDKGMDDKPLYALGGSKYHELMYNLGVSLLHAKRPVQAFDCLIIAVRRYHRNARLWMRLAECCIMATKESNEVDFDIQKRQKEIIVNVIGSQDKQKVILTTNVSKDKKYSTESQSYAVPVPSLEFASLCLRNASTLLPSDTVSSPIPLFLIPGGIPPVPSCSPSPAPSSPLSPESVMSLRNSILAASAYVALCLGDYILALEHAENLLQQPRLSGAHKLLGHLYCAEALVLLDKISEALEHLNPENVKHINLELPKGDENEEKRIKTSPPLKWFPHNLPTAIATMQYNFAVAKTIRGQLEDAIGLLKQIWQMSSKCKVPGHIIMLLLYIELKLGRPEPARKLVKQYLFQNRRKHVEIHHSLLRCS
ncbi:CCR4-NOT transcription complex subunit 10 isoform X1 [Tribolium castaneum]|uniref:CCR4-NOT transcription complex subunit 10 n=1 Tax=Tribolium castaneum TaxID=7070 RepID=D6WQ07_TRICA|nr:PREDICTED: CCR4-NOT transcription complex subunit 10 isoform X2 [Tribolium castaneum]EFA06148.2 CCR4-NOT transcription complex subunit 10 homolog-like Protein [Tribolium castaneum]|eukprot:XP_008195677.2 PREDICTED: CCR4-NOT transcription complex subunit 10 isoform X2 [Tribolium castaneum]